MSVSKSNLFSPEHSALADFAAVLSHPARIQMILLLQQQGRLTCGELVKALPLAQATVSQHLKILTEAGLLEGHSEGQRIYYELQCEALRNFCHTFQCTLGTQTPEKS
ncbi:MAG: ArsR/SmtB family transcription factor [Kiritimatiellia bacterium]